jgi:prepilin-type processing-associated H-X9-DG protein
MDRTTIPPPSRRAAFSLMELLVVIAIVMTLAALLLPVVATLRTMAKGAVCQSNLRQCGMGVLAYVTEWEGHLPSAGNPSTGNPPPWPYVLINAGHTEAGVVICPDPTVLPRRWNGWSMSYGMEYWHNRAGGALWTGDWITLARVPTPSTYVWMADSIYPAGGGTPFQIAWIMGNTATLTSNLVHRRHRQRANCLFLDIHVEALDRDRLTGLGQQCFSWNSYPF